jgi:cytochrome c-type biogenesis protein CcmH/NrfG
MSEEMQLALEHTLKTMRELKEAKAEIKRLRAALRDVLWYADQLEKVTYDESDWPSEHEVMRKARAALAEETPCSFS